MNIQQVATKVIGIAVTKPSVFVLNNEFNHELNENTLKFEAEKNNFNSVCLDMPKIAEELFEQTQIEERTTDYFLYLSSGPEINQYVERFVKKNEE